MRLQYKDGHQTKNLKIHRVMKEPAVVCKENSMADASDKASAKLRNRQWTQTELKYFDYFALVLADENH